MGVKVFLLGRPGSGKSTAALLIEMLANDYNNWFTYHINDYRLLQGMFLQEKAQRTPAEKSKFRSTGPKEYDGFDVIDFSVLNTALKMMEEEVREKERKLSAENPLFLIEFARANYNQALQQFSQDFLRSAYVVYLNVNLEICIRRIHQRVVHPMKCNDHYVSDDIMRNYYCEDDWPYVFLDLRQGHNLRVKEIDNTGLPRDLARTIEDFLGPLLRKKDSEDRERSERDKENLSPSNEPLETLAEDLIGV